MTPAPSASPPPPSASVSAEPPLLSFGIGTGASSWPAVSEADHVGVHILGEHQQELATTFARSGADRFGAPTAWREGPEGVPVLDDVLAWLVCRVVARVPAGDHRIVLAEAVLGDPAGPAGRSLYHQGRFNASARLIGSSPVPTCLAAVEFRLRCVAKVTVQSACLAGMNWVYWRVIFRSERGPPRPGSAP